MTLAEFCVQFYFKIEILKYYQLELKSKTTMPHFTTTEL